MNKRLTNLDISENYRDSEYWFMKSDFMGAFAYWVVAQSPYSSPDITSALKAFDKYISKYITDDMPENFGYEDLSNIINEDALVNVPEILELNERKNKREGMGFCSRYDKPSPDDDFIDLGALARNVFYMLLREHITH